MIYNVIDKVYSIIIDVMNGVCSGNGKATFYNTDSNTSFIEVTVTNGVFDFDMTKYSYVLVLNRPNKTTYKNEYKCTDPNKLLIKLDSGMLSSIGTNKAQLYIMDIENNKVLTMVEFNYIVKAGNYDALAPESKNQDALYIEMKKSLDNLVKVSSGVVDLDIYQTKEDTLQALNQLNSQLDNKANQNSVFSMANMGQDIKEAMTGGSVAVVGKDAVLAENIVDGQVKCDKVSFLEIHSKNLINPNKIKNINILSNGNEVVSENYVTTDFIKVLSNDVLYASRKEDLSYAKNIMFSIALYDENKRFISLTPHSNLITTTIYTYFEKLDVNFNGFIRIVIPILYSKNLCITKDICGFEEYKYLINDEIKQKDSIPLFPVKNIINEDKSIKGVLSQFGNINNTDAYYTTDFIEIDKNVNYIISPSVRVVVVYNEYKKPILNDIFINDLTNNCVINSAFAAYVRVSYPSTNYGNMQMERGTIPTEYEKYKLSIPYLYQSSTPEVNNVLLNKKLLGFGDSIGAGDGNNGVGYTEMIGEKNSMQYYDYAVGGATVAVVDGNTNNILKRINDAIINNVQADYILFDGGTNDVSAGTTMGSITNGWSEPLDTSTFCGAFETICKILKTHWLGAKIVYVRVHNMSSRTVKQITYGDLAEQMCQKWSIPIVNMYKEGGLNTQIPEMKSAYTMVKESAPNGDATHPNELGYSLYYVPMIESKLKTL